MPFIITGIVFFVILTVLVLIHELGHFMAARFFGVRVLEFGLGLPPKIAGKKIGETEYTVNWLPIGGFVRLAGEDQDPSERSKKLDAATRNSMFWAKSKKQRAVILSAGVIMNFFLAVAITSFLLINGVHEPTGRVHVERVIENSPAMEAGIEQGDIIQSAYIDRETEKDITMAFSTPAELIEFSREYGGEEVLLTVFRGEDALSVTLVPRADPPSGQGPIGIAISDLEKRSYGITEAPGKALVINTTRVRDMVVSLGVMLKNLVTFRQAKVEVAGPIGIAQVTARAIDFGWEAVLELASILSLNLAVLNILPIPALDGGRLAFVFLEKMLRRKVNPVLEQHAHQIGMLILILLIFLISIQDILRIVGRV